MDFHTGIWTPIWCYGIWTPSELAQLHGWWIQAVCTAMSKVIGASFEQSDWFHSFHVPRAAVAELGHPLAHQVQMMIISSAFDIGLTDSKAVLFGVKSLLDSSISRSSSQAGWWAAPWLSCSSLKILCARIWRSSSSEKAGCLEHLSFAVKRLSFDLDWEMKIFAGHPSVTCYSSLEECWWGCCHAYPSRLCNKAFDF